MQRCCCAPKAAAHWCTAHAERHDALRKGTRPLASTCARWQKGLKTVFAGQLQDRACRTSIKHDGACSNRTEVTPAARAPGPRLQVAAHAPEVGRGRALLKRDAHPQDQVGRLHVLLQHLEHVVGRDHVACGAPARRVSPSRPVLASGRALCFLGFVSSLRDLTAVGRACALTQQAFRHEEVGRVAAVCWEAEH